MTWRLQWNVYMEGAGEEERENAIGKSISREFQEPSSCTLLFLWPVFNGHRTSSQIKSTQRIPYCMLKTILCCQTFSALNCVWTAFPAWHSSACLLVHLASLPWDTSHLAHLPASSCPSRTTKIPILCNAPVTTFWRCSWSQSLESPVPRSSSQWTFTFFLISLWDWTRPSSSYYGYVYECVYMYVCSSAAIWFLLSSYICSSTWKYDRNKTYEVPGILER